MNRIAENKVASDMAKWTLYGSHEHADSLLPTLEVPSISLLKDDQLQFTLSPKEANSWPQSFYRSLLKIKKLLTSTFSEVKELSTYSLCQTKLNNLVEELEYRMRQASQDELLYLIPQYEVAAKAANLFTEIIEKPTEVKKCLTEQIDLCNHKHNQIEDRILREHEQNTGTYFNHLCLKNEETASSLLNQEGPIQSISSQILESLASLQLILQFPDTSNKLEAFREKINKISEEYNILHKKYSDSTKVLNAEVVRNISDLKSLSKMINRIYQYLPTAEKSLDKVLPLLQTCEENRLNDLQSLEESNKTQYQHEVEKSTHVFWEKFLNFEVDKLSIKDISTELVVVGLELGRASHDPNQLKEVISEALLNYKDADPTEMNILEHMIEYAQNRKKNPELKIYEQIVLAGVYKELFNFNRESRTELAMHLDSIENHSTIWNSVVRINPFPSFESLSLHILGEVFGIKDSDDDISTIFPNVPPHYKKYIKDLLGPESNLKATELLERISHHLPEEANDQQELPFLLLKLALKIKSYTEGEDYDPNIIFEYKSTKKALKKMKLTQDQIDGLLHSFLGALEEIRALEDFASSDKSYRLEVRRSLVRKEVADHLKPRVNDLDEFDFFPQSKESDENSAQTSVEVSTPFSSASRIDSAPFLLRNSSSASIRPISTPSLKSPDMFNPTPRAKNTTDNNELPLPLIDRIPLSSDNSVFRRVTPISRAVEGDSRLSTMTSRLTSLELAEIRKRSSTLTPIQAKKTDENTSDNDADISDHESDSEMFTCDYTTKTSPY